MKQLLQKGALALGLVAATAVPAHADVVAATPPAGTDTTFNPIATLIRGWMEGSLGFVFGLIGVGYAAFQLFAGRWGGVAVGLGAAAIMSFGPAVIGGMFPAVI